jgi:DNA-binding transcriptional ArsR family regulator
VNWKYLILLRPGRTAVSDKRLKALSHDVRLEILGILNEREATPSEIQAELGLSRDLVNYHLRMLEEGDCVEAGGPAGEEKSSEYPFRATQRALLTADDMEALPLSVKKLLSGGLLRYIYEAASRAQLEDTLDARNDRHLSATPLQLDEQGWGQLIDAAEDFLDSVLEIERTSAKRLARGKESFTAMVALMAFEMPPGRWQRQPRGRLASSG